jgi:hypothetical protein
MTTKLLRLSDGYPSVIFDLAAKALGTCPEFTRVMNQGLEGD